MRRVLSPAFAVLAACALSAPAPAAGGPAVAAARDTGSYRVLAGPYSRKDIKAGAGTPVARATLGELTISVEFLDPGARAAFVRSIVPTISDPFAVRSGRPEMYSVFRVSFSNGSGADVQFQPKNVVLLTDRKTENFPVDLTDLYRGAEAAGLADPERVFERLAPIVFDSGTTIATGAGLARPLGFG